MKSMNRVCYIVIVSLIVFVLLFSLIACGKTGGTENEMTTQQSTSELLDTMPNEPQVDFEQYDLISFHFEAVENSISSSNFYQIYLILQNKSAEKSLSDISFNYWLDNSYRGVLSSTENLPYKLLPRKKAFLHYSGLSSQAELFGITSYSYSLDGSIYTVDLINKTISAKALSQTESKDYVEKNILSFKSNSLDSFVLTNNSTQPISNVKVRVARVDENNNYLGADEQTVLEKTENLAAGKSLEFQIKIDDVIYYEGDYGFIKIAATEIIGYSYTGELDDSDNNTFSVDLIKKAVDSSANNVYKYNNYKALSKEEIEKEIKKYVSCLGKQSSESGFEFVSTKVANPYIRPNKTGEYCYLDANESFLELTGKLYFVRDYDSLELTSFSFYTKEADADFEAYMLDCLTKAYGLDFDEHHTDDLSSYKWETETISIDYYHYNNQDDWVSFALNDFKENNYHE